MGMAVKGCCCMSLRVAGLVHGWVGIALLVIGISVTVTRLIRNDFDEIQINSYTFQQPRTEQQEIITLVLYLFDVLISGLLIAGIMINKHYLLLPWLILRAIGLVLSAPIIILILFFTAFTFKAEVFLATMIFSIIVGLFMWSWVVIYSLYKEIRNSNNPPPMQSPLAYYESQSYPVDPAPPYQVFDKQNNSYAQK